MRAITPPLTLNLGMDEYLNFVTAFLRRAPTFNVIRVSADYTVLKDDFYVGVTDTTIARTLTLPPIESVFLDAMMIVKDESGGAGANNITIDGDGAETIDGAATKVINANYGVFRIKRGPTQWFTW